MSRKVIILLINPKVKKCIITLLHIPHHNSAPVTPYEVFELVLVFLSWEVQISVHVLEVDKTPKMVRLQQNEDFLTKFQWLILKRNKYKIM